jgi:peptidoglycan/LPS O-acetylase OafA/YrhL
MAGMIAASSSFSGLPPWWHWPLGVCALFFGGTMALCAVHWPRSPTPGVEFRQDIVIPLGFTLLACVGIVGGYALLSTR